LGQIHVAAAAQTEDGVRLEFVGHAQTSIRCPKRWLRLAAWEHLNRHPAVTQGRGYFIHQAGLLEDGIGHDQDPRCMQPLGHLPQLANGIAPKKQLTCRMKRPGLTHAETPQCSGTRCDVRLLVPQVVSETVSRNSPECYNSDQRPSEDILRWLGN